MNGKLPAIQFYPADWRKDPGVQSLTFEERGIWFEIICLMHESDKRGILLLNGKKMSTEHLSRILGLDIQILTKALTSIHDVGVSSIDEETGALMNRRMVRDEKLREIRRNCGSLGGNPALVNQKSTTKDNQKPTPSSSVSSSASNKKRASKSQINPELFIEQLKANPIYSHINIDRELGKMDVWISANPPRTKTRRFVLNWLNKIEVPIGPSKPSAPKGPCGVFNEPLLDQPS